MEETAMTGFSALPHPLKGVAAMNKWGGFQFFFYLV